MPAVVLLIHQPTVALNKLKFVKNINHLRVNFSDKLYLISAFVSWCTNYTNVYGKVKYMSLRLVWVIKWRISFRVKVVLWYENCVQYKNHIICLCEKKLQVCFLLFSQVKVPLPFKGLNIGGYLYLVMGSKDITYILSNY